MMKQKPVLVYVGDTNRSQALALTAHWIVFDAPKLRDALAQVIFSYPDAVVIDAEHDTLLAEDAYYHLRTINHPPIIILSDVPRRWKLPKEANVAIMPSSSSDLDVMDRIHQMLTGDGAFIL